MAWKYKRSTERTITDTDELLTVLDKVREQGMAKITRSRKKAALHRRSMSLTALAW